MTSLAIEIAIKRILRTPGISLLVVGALAIGVGLVMPMVTLYYNISGNPMSANGDTTYRVLVGEPRSGEDSMPAIKMDSDLALRVMDVLGETRQAVSYSSFQNVRNAPDDPITRPMFTEVRVTTRGFFTMFDAPVRYGSIWSDVDDQKINNVAVLGHATNVRLFGGENSVGRRFRLGDDEYTVVGVLDRWPLVPRIYDIGRTGNAKPEGVFVPLSGFERPGIEPFDFSFVAGDRNTRARSGAVEFVTFWVQLNDASSFERVQKQLAMLTQSSTTDQPRSWAVYSADDWVLMSPDLQNRKRIYRAFILINLCFFCVCLFNLLSLLLAKVFAQASETSLLRALGASRIGVFGTYMLEVAILGVVGAVLSIFVSRAAMNGLYWLYVDNLPSKFQELQMQEGTELIYAQVDLALLVMTLATGLLGALLSVAVPALRASQTHMAEHLKAS
ncbi:MAG: ABC transporter permease [Pseudomonadota bacterium]